MKISEVRHGKSSILETNREVDEGILDFFKSDPNVHTPSKQQKKQTKQREQGIKQLIDRAYDSWRDHLEQVRSALPDQYNGEIPPERLKKDLTTFIQNNIMGGAKVDSAQNSEDLTHYIDSLSGVESTLPASEPRTPPSTTRPPVAPVSTAAPSPAAEPSVQTPDTQPAAVEPEAVPEYQEPFLNDPNVATNSVERTSADPLILKYERHKYVIGDEGEWTKFGDKKPVDQVLQKLLNTAAGEFEDNDLIMQSNRATTGTQPSGQWIQDPQTGEQKWQSTVAAPQASGATGEAPPLMPGQTYAPPSPEQAAAERAAYQADLEAQAQAGKEALARAESERLAADAAEREAGIEPPSRGLIRKPGSGRGMAAEFEPIKESLRNRMAAGEITLVEAKIIYRAEKRRVMIEAAEKLSVAREKELFGKLVRAALLARAPAPAQRSTGGTAPGAPRSAEEVETPEISNRDQRKIATLLGGDREAKKAGSDIRDELDAGNTVRTTGNAAADAALLAMGFKIK